MDVLMPQLGETVDEGKVLVWYKKVGDKVEPGENLFEIETEKVSMEVPSTVAGTLREIRVQVDETAPVGAVVAVIAEEGAQPASASQPSADKALPSQPAPRRATTQAVSSATAPAAPTYVARKLEPFKEVFTPERNYGPARVGGVETTPYARRLAGEAGISLSSLRGSGPNGRIVAKDIEAQRGKGAQSQIKSLYEAGTYTEQPVDAMRRAIARRLTESKQTIPHFYLTIDLEVDTLMSLREQRNAALPSQAAAKLSVNDLIIKAWAVALRAVPRANAVWAEDSILQFNRSDIGVAIAVDGGLVTPVVRAADAKSAWDISADVKDFAARARAKKLKAADLQGGASAISNLGMYGVREFSAIINPPQSTVLAVGAVQRRPTETAEGGVRFATLMTVTLSCDHRVVDGALGAELLAALRDIVQQRAATLA
ncbi:MAG TPA: dihydrolipoamide acetyltransferase family protein [Steroidobacteraceae bacterium]|nr:dihydrolipoamide acetyltransferase family protein [Steroidobacteraceae bacterium]